MPPKNKAPANKRAAKKKTKKSAGPTPVEAITHDDAERTNIPTRELEDFAADDELAPNPAIYERDPSLDPQLVWKGKDPEEFEVPAVPIYIQEKIDPRVIIEHLRDTAKPGEEEPELTLFDEFDADLDFAEKVDFYEHADRWKNRLILGDSLLVMTSLAEKEDLKGQVQTIYVDPPYGIKFGSNWQVSTRKRDVKDGKADDLTREPEQIKAFRDTWELGIHSYLSYLRDRLVVARDLLTESGSIFVQIGDENVHLVRSLMDEVFGSENFVSLITHVKTGGSTGEFLAGTTDFVLWYAKTRTALKFRPLYLPKALDGEGASKYNQVELASSERRALTAAERRDMVLPADGRLFRYDNLTSQSAGRAKGHGASSWFEVEVEGETFRPTMQTRWKTNEVGMARLQAAGRVARTGRSLAYVRFLDDFPAYALSNVWTDVGGVQSRADPKVYVVQTASTAIERCLLMSTDPGDLVLDPTCGSGSTARVAEEWGRRWITSDTSRVALGVTRTRLMSSAYPYYLLADSEEGATKDAAERGESPVPPPYKNDIRKGFAYKRVPHITLKSIAQNPDIEEGMSRDEIDAAIRRNADIETLYDQPFEDKKVVRVTGPFTVESLSPHRALQDDQGDAPSVPESEQLADEEPQQGSYEQMVVDNLRAAGVQNTVRQERLEFDSLDLFAGRYVQAAGTYTKAGKSERIAVAIGPENGTVGPRLVKEAAKEALKGQGFDLLLVCGFAFDASAPEAAAEFADSVEGEFATTAAEQQLGKLPVQLVKMNPDLSMGEDLLKKTGSGNLFMIFGEPDIEVRELDEGELVVEIKGVDVYDPTTGEIRSHSTDDIACWFVDTDYDGESFFVRHAYFTGADEPYEKLQKALKADIDPDAWATLYRTESRPFPKPSTGRIAVKVINHYGDEILQVREV